MVCLALGLLHSKGPFINYDLGGQQISRGNTRKTVAPLREYTKNKRPPYGIP